jgi:acetyltransferase-like isoleucine patch superfamily enzyme
MRSSRSKRPLLSHNVTQQPKNKPQRNKDVSYPIRRPIEDPLALIPRGLTRMYSMWVSLTYPFASIGRNVSFHFTSRVSRQRARRVSIGNAVRIGEHAWLNVATDDPSGEPTIVIGDDCIVASGTIISARNRIHLGHDVNVAQQVLIMDHNHAYEDPEIPIVNQGITNGGRIRIGEGSWIGHGAAILCSRDELTIGRHCVVSANSVVTRSIPDYSVVFGIPATIIRQYDAEKKAWRMGQLRSSVTADRENIVSLSSVSRQAGLIEKS